MAPLKCLEGQRLGGEKGVCLPGTVFCKRRANASDGHVGPTTWPAHSVGMLEFRAKRVKMIACGGTKTFHAGYTTASWSTSFRSRQAVSRGFFFFSLAGVRTAAGWWAAIVEGEFDGLGSVPSTASGPILVPSPYLDAAAGRARCHGRRAYIHGNLSRSCYPTHQGIVCFRI